MGLVGLARGSTWVLRTTTARVKRRGTPSTTRRFDYPRRVRLDLEPPTATYVYAYTTGALDPSAGIGDALFLDINASEPVVAPRVTLEASSSSAETSPSAGRRRSGARVRTW